MEKKSPILEHGLYIAWAIAVIATAGSLYFSEVKEYIPCTYCWYQRILMYPLVILMGIAAVRKDYKQVIYMLPITLIGMCLSLFHYLKQKTNWFASGSDACALIPCDIEYINLLGFITIPFLAFVAFSLITIIQLLIWVEVRKRNN